MDTNRVVAETANRVAAAIARANLTQTEVAERSGIPRVTLHRKLKGAQPFNVLELAKIAEPLGIPWDSFTSQQAESRAA